MTGVALKDEDWEHLPSYRTVGEDEVIRLVSAPMQLGKSAHLRQLYDTPAETDVLVAPMETYRGWRDEFDDVAYKLNYTGIPEGEFYIDWSAGDDDLPYNPPKPQGARRYRSKEIAKRRRRNKAARRARHG